MAEVVAHLPEKLMRTPTTCCVEGLVAALTHSARRLAGPRFVFTSRGEGLGTAFAVDHPDVRRPKRRRLRP